MKSARPVTHRIEGTNVTRKSARYYTHAVVADFDRVAAEAAYAPHAIAMAKANHPYYVAIASARPGDVVSGYERSAAEIERAQEYLSNYPTPEARAAAELSDWISASPKHGELVVLQWSQSARAAASKVGSFAKRRQYRNVRVVPVQRGARKVSEMPKDEVRAVFQKAAGEAVATFERERSSA